MKTCFKCKKEKPLTEFYKHKKMSDGHLGKCKECTKKDSIENRNKNIEYYREYDRERGKLPHRKDLATRVTKEYRKQWPFRYSANNIVNNAIRDGKLKKQPCEECGSKYNVHGHHDNYSYPMMVRWLCQICHKEWHKHNEPIYPEAK